MLILPRGVHQLYNHTFLVEEDLFLPTFYPMDYSIDYQMIQDEIHLIYKSDTVETILYSFKPKHPIYSYFYCVKENLRRLIYG